MKPKAVFALDKIVCNGNGGATGERSCTEVVCRGILEIDVAIQNQTLWYSSLLAVQ